MQISVIIPTYNRMKDVDECLDSIIVQTTLPMEVIIVDNGIDIKTENLIKIRKNEFKEKNIILKYIKNERENSLTVAKNIGVKHSAGDIISFLDDDLILDKNYDEEIMKIYKEKTNALGVQGVITNLEKLKVNTLHKLFFLGFEEKNKCKVLPSVYSTSPISLDKDKIIECERLSGAATYKRCILEEFKFDENLKKYSYGEDTDFSYRIFKKYPDSLFMAPRAKYFHRLSQEGRIPNKDLFFMKIIYNFYIFYKDMDQNIKNKIIYLWSRIGYLVMNMGIILIKTHDKRFLQFTYLIRAYIYCMKHRREIKEGNLEFFNKCLR